MDEDENKKPSDEKLSIELGNVARAMQHHMPHVSKFVCTAADRLRHGPEAPMPDFLKACDPEDLTRRLVAAGTCLFPLQYQPTVVERALVLNRLKRAFGIPATVAHRAAVMWEERCQPNHQSPLFTGPSPSYRYPSDFRR